MKNLIIFSSVLLSLSAMAEQNLEGHYAGEDCALEIGKTLSHVQAGDINCTLDRMKESEKSVELKGFNEIEFCKVSVKLDSEGNPTSFKLKTRGPFNPIYSTMAICLDLKKI